MGDYFNSYTSYVEKIQSRKIVLFGAGYGLKDLLSWCYRPDDIAFVIDNDKSKWGGSVYNLEVKSPEALKDNPDGYVVVIDLITGQEQNYQIKRIIWQLKSLGVENVFTRAELALSNVIERYDTAGKPKFNELSLYKLVKENAKKIDEVRTMLSDKQSVEIFEQYIYKLKYNIRDYSDVADDLLEHYFSHEFFIYGDKEVFIDGGAYDGDDTVWLADLLDHGNRLDSAFVFEPDRKNFFITCSNISDYSKDTMNFSPDAEMCRVGKYQIMRYGLYDRSSTAVFSQNGNHSSHIGSGGSSDIKTVALDDIEELNNKKVTLIKYDLEGADVPALFGAKNIIMRDKPKMCLSVYHKPEDLWEIPLLIKSWVPEYKFFLRHHTDVLWDKVLYVTM